MTRNPPSPWLADLPGVPPCPPLAGEHEVDVAIIGGGFTGLSSALALRREGLSVVVLEAETVGFGASGRNAGHLTPTIGKDLPTLTMMYGEERVRALIHLAETAIAHVEGLIARHGIDCEYEPVGNVIAAVHERQHKNLDKVARAAREYDLPGELLEADDLERRGLPRAFTRGFLEPHGGVLQPARYVRGLRQAALDAGAVLHEQTRVTGVDDGPQLVVHTPAGRVRARFVVLGTNAFTPRLGWLRSAAIPLQVQLFRTAPLSAAQKARVGWPGREGIYTAHEILESYRLTADDRIVGGSKAVRYGYGGRPLPDVEAPVSDLLERTFRARFPELHDVAVTDRWGGPIYLALDFLPVVGRGGRHGNVLHAVAYAGHGVAQASYAGEMVTDLLLERDGPGSVLWTRRRVPLPPEPMRWLIHRGLTRLLAGIDRRADHAARGRAAAVTRRSA
jgi:glycine/D-amino acid oxidase-like deaminating enzyme